MAICSCINMLSCMYGHMQLHQHVVLLFSKQAFARFINKAIRSNRCIVMRSSSYKQIRNKQWKLRSVELTTEAAMRLRRPELHDNAPKKETTLQAPPSPRPHRSTVFTRSPIAERVATTMSSRGSWHPQASPSLAPKRWDKKKNRGRMDKKKNINLSRYWSFTWNICKQNRRREHHIPFHETEKKLMYIRTMICTTSNLDNQKCS
jgi:hypothetical protein